MKKFFWTVLVIMMATTMSVNLASCGDDDETVPGTGNVGNTTEKIKNRDLMGYWEFNGTIAPNLWIKSDGICEVNGAEQKWAYDTETKTLAITGGYTYIIKLLTSDMLSAEWSSVKYGTRTDTWTATAPNGLDPQWEKLIIGTWKLENGSSITFKDGKFDAKLNSRSTDEPTLEFSGTYSTDYNGALRLTSNENFKGEYYDYNKKPKEGEMPIDIQISGISGNRMRLRWTETGNLTSIDIDGALYYLSHYISGIYTFVND